MRHEERYTDSDGGREAGRQTDRDRDWELVANSTLSSAPLAFDKCNDKMY